MVDIGLDDYILMYTDFWLQIFKFFSQIFNQKVNLLIQVIYFKNIKLNGSQNFWLLFLTKHLNWCKGEIMKKYLSGIDIFS